MTSKIIFILLQSTYALSYQDNLGYNGKIAGKVMHDLKQYQMDEPVSKALEQSKYDFKQQAADLNGLSVESRIASYNGQDTVNFSNDVHSELARATLKITDVELNYGAVFQERVCEHQTTHNLRPGVQSQIGKATAEFPIIQNGRNKESGKYEYLYKQQTLAPDTIDLTYQETENTYDLTITNKTGAAINAYTINSLGQEVSPATHIQDEGVLDIETRLGQPWVFRGLNDKVLATWNPTEVPPDNEVTMVINSIDAYIFKYDVTSLPEDTIVYGENCKEEYMWTKDWTIEPMTIFTGQLNITEPHNHGSKEQVMDILGEVNSAGEVKLTFKDELLYRPKYEGHYVQPTIHGEVNLYTPEEQKMNNLEMDQQAQRLEHPERLKHCDRNKAWALKNTEDDEYPDKKSNYCKNDVHKVCEAMTSATCTKTIQEKCTQAKPVYTGYVCFDGLKKLCVDNNVNENNCTIKILCDRGHIDNQHEICLDLNRPVAKEIIMPNKWTDYDFGTTYTPVPVKYGAVHYKNSGSESNTSDVSLKFDKRTGKGTQEDRLSEDYINQNDDYILGKWRAAYGSRYPPNKFFLEITLEEIFWHNEDGDPSHEKFINWKDTSHNEVNDYDSTAPGAKTWNRKMIRIVRLGYPDMRFELLGNGLLRWTFEDYRGVQGTIFYQKVTESDTGITEKLKEFNWGDIKRSEIAKLSPEFLTKYESLLPKHELFRLISPFVKPGNLVCEVERGDTAKLVMNFDSHDSWQTRLTITEKNCVNPQTKGNPCFTLKDNNGRTFYRRTDDNSVYAATNEEKVVQEDTDTQLEGILESLNFMIFKIETGHWKLLQTTHEDDLEAFLCIYDNEVAYPQLKCLTITIEGLWMFQQIGKIEPVPKKDNQFTLDREPMESYLFRFTERSANNHWVIHHVNTLKKMSINKSTQEVNFKITDGPWKLAVDLPDCWEDSGKPEFEGEPRRLCMHSQNNLALGCFNQGPSPEEEKHESTMVPTGTLWNFEYDHTNTGFKITDVMGHDLRVPCSSHHVYPIIQNGESKESGEYENLYKQTHIGDQFPGGLLSKNEDKPYTLIVENKTGARITAYKYDTDGDQQGQYTMVDKEKKTIQTHETHPWVFKNDNTILATWEASNVDANDKITIQIKPIDKYITERKCVQALAGIERINPRWTVIVFEANGQPNTTPVESVADIKNRKFALKQGSLTVGTKNNGNDGEQYYLYKNCDSPNCYLHIEGEYSCGKVTMWSTDGQKKDHPQIYQYANSGEHENNMPYHTNGIVNGTSTLKHRIYGENHIYEEGGLNHGKMSRFESDKFTPGESNLPNGTYWLHKWSKGMMNWDPWYPFFGEKMQTKPLMNMILSYPLYTGDQVDTTTVREINPDETTFTVHAWCSCQSKNSYFLDVREATCEEARKITEYCDGVGEFHCVDHDDDKDQAWWENWIHQTTRFHKVVCQPTKLNFDRREDNKEKMLNHAFAVVENVLTVNEICHRSKFGECGPVHDNKYCAPRLGEHMWCYTTGDPKAPWNNMCHSANSSVWDNDDGDINNLPKAYGSLAMDECLEKDIDQSWKITWDNDSKWDMVFDGLRKKAEIFQYDHTTGMPFKYTVTLPPSAGFSERFVVFKIDGEYQKTDKGVWTGVETMEEATKHVIIPHTPSRGYQIKEAQSYYFAAPCKDDPTNKICGAQIAMQKIVDENRFVEGTSMNVLGAMMTGGIPGDSQFNQIGIWDNAVYNELNDTKKIVDNNLMANNGGRCKCLNGQIYWVGLSHPGQIDSGCKGGHFKPYTAAEIQRSPPGDKQGVNCGMWSYVNRGYRNFLAQFRKQHQDAPAHFQRQSNLSHWQNQFKDYQGQVEKIKYTAKRMSQAKDMEKYNHFYNIWIKQTAKLEKMEGKNHNSKCGPPLPPAPPVVSEQSLIEQKCSEAYMLGWRITKNMVLLMLENHETPGELLKQTKCIKEYEAVQLTLGGKNGELGAICMRKGSGDAGKLIMTLAPYPDKIRNLLKGTGDMKQWITMHRDNGYATVEAMMQKGELMSKALIHGETDEHIKKIADGDMNNHKPFYHGTAKVDRDITGKRTKTAEKNRQDYLDKIEAQKDSDYAYDTTNMTGNEAHKTNQTGVGKYIDWNYNPATGRADLEEPEQTETAV